MTNSPGILPFIPLPAMPDSARLAKKWLPDCQEKPAFGALLNAVKSGWRIWRQRRMDRQAFQHMIALDDHILRDIGVTRSDVIWASRLPLSQNAALELQKLTLQKRKR